MFPATLGGVTPRARVLAIVSLVGLMATGSVVLYAAWLGGEPPSLASALKPRTGAPPLALDLGVRVDPETVDLRRALVLYDQGHRAQAAGVFQAYESLEAQVGQAIAAWPKGSLGRLDALAATHPRSGVVQVNLGLARFWAGRPGSEEAWRRAAVVQPDSSYAITAGNLLFPSFNRNLPTFVPAEAVPAELNGKSPPQQLAILRRNSSEGSAKAKLLYGVALQRLFRPISARRDRKSVV